MNLDYENFCITSMEIAMKTFSAFFLFVVFSLPTISIAETGVIYRNTVSESLADEGKDKTSSGNNTSQNSPPYSQISYEVSSPTHVKDETEWQVLDTNEDSNADVADGEAYDKDNDDMVLFDLSSGDEIPLITDNAGDEYGAPVVVGKELDLEQNLDDVWDRIRQGFGMPDFKSKLVHQEELWYVRHHKTTVAIFERAKPYLHYIVDQVQKHSMPTEFSLLPIVESAYNPFALSPAQASGLWQFIPSTGKKYNLSQNWWIDKRRDIVASTKAALKYFTNLHNQFGDWQLSLAGYNWGESAVQNAIMHNQRYNMPADYEHLKMPRETRHYIPKLQALKNIINNPGAYGFELPHIINKPYLVAVEITNTLDIPTAANLAELPISQFLHLNPAFKRLVINSSKKDKYILLLPYDRKETFLKNLDDYRKHNKKLSHWHIYYIYQKTPIRSVAKKFHVKTSQILLSNGLNPSTRWVHGTLLIPDAKNPIPTAIENQIHEIIPIPEQGENFHYQNHRRHRYHGRHHIGNIFGSHIRS